jgi:subtilase family serine protease
MNRKIFAVCVGIFAAGMALYASARVRGKERDGQHRWPRITQRIDEHDRVILPGNTRPEANAKDDRGRVPDDLPMDNMMMLLKRSPQQDTDLQQFLTALQDKNSPNYHQWITPEQFGTQFGVDPADISTVTAWLAQHGFTVNFTYPSGMMIDFSGTAGEVAEAFHTEIHYVEARGKRHIANMSDPQIPAALEPVVTGIVALHDFEPRPMLKPKVSPAYTIGSGTFAVVPPDVATIYNFNPLFAAGISGQGETIAVVEDTNLYSSSDWTTFRTTFGLAGYGGTLTTIHPAPAHGSACSNPGVNSDGDDGEAILDASYASAAAPSAAIVVASCRSVFTAIQNVVESAAPPNIMSVSYGGCEAEEGATANAALNNAYATGVAASISIFVSSGDEGAASCDPDTSQAEHGIGVSSWASSPNVVAVGGTDFADSYLGTTGTYWNNTNTSTFGSAKSYIPEIPWNDSCGSALFVAHYGFGQSYGTGGFCNSSTGEANYLTTGSGSGGPSGCATGAAAITGVVSGTCAGYAKPSWQSGIFGNPNGLFGNPNDNVRDIPDVSLFAANGLWGHYYLVCYSDTVNGGTPCTGAPSGWSGFGGTSISSPIMAGIMALVDQVHGAQGAPNPTLYKIANQEYGASGTTTCNSSSLAVAPRGSVYNCPFYDITLGDMDVNCLAFTTGSGHDGQLHNCYLPSGTNGVLTTDNTNSTYVLAYGTNAGWDFATGIGSVNAFFLVVNPNW